MKNYCEHCGQPLPKRELLADQIGTAYYKYKADFNEYPNILYIGEPSHYTLLQEMGGVFSPNRCSSFGSSKFMGMNVVVTDNIKYFKVGFVR